MIYLALCKGETSFRFDTAVQRLAICAELENVLVYRDFFRQHEQEFNQTGGSYG